METARRPAARTLRQLSAAVQEAGAWVQPARQPQAAFSWRLSCLVKVLPVTSGSSLVWGGGVC